MKKILLSVVILSTSLFSYTQCDEIFISEYVEGWSNNKAIELVNPTSSAINLSQYELRRYSNGSNVADPSTKRIQLSGVIASKGTFVIVIDKRDSTGTGQEAPVWDTLQNRADIFMCPNYTVNNVMYFNGNDAMALFKGTKVIDVIGKVGEDPGAVNGVTSQNKAFGWPLISVSMDSTAWTKDHVMVRKFNVTSGDINPSDVFDPRTEWDTLSPLNFSHLGYHSCNCTGLTGTPEIVKEEKFSVFPNPSNTGNITLQSSSLPTKVEVISIIGSKVIETTSTSTTTVLNTSKLTKGIYFVALSFENGQRLTKKIVLN